jgi:hypothetical protein
MDSGDAHLPIIWVELIGLHEWWDRGAVDPASYPTLLYLIHHPEVYV